MPHKLSRELCSAQPEQRFYVGSEAYALGNMLGEGAAGLVFKATRLPDKSPPNTPGRRVRWAVPNQTVPVYMAVKFLAPDPKHIDEATFDDVAARFKREGERGSQLEHQRLLKVFAFEPNHSGDAFLGQDGPSNPFILMEFLPGKTLEEYIRQLPAKSQRTFEITRPRLSIAIQVAQALKYLHARSLIHRDVKPANIFLLSEKDYFLLDDEGAPRDEVDGIIQAKVGDFGIVKWGDFHAHVSTGVLTATNQKELGTMKYMSPEQAVRPKEVTARSDIYSLGITLFELFTGQILASPHHVFEVMSARMTRGTTYSRFMSMGYMIGSGDEAVAEMLLDMHLRGVTSRPTIEKVLRALSYEYESRFGADSILDFD